ncbi:1-deoxy-D-xylulose-5-phosphate synthase N-terminal domain-containing protein [Streptomyces sp. NPDC006923]|uniref:1-deoxy-D-xylulose-5-phosphate synthase N-terminal domain-containing protein n=1 Tax=Streptomyces sp. NPDC006923 TaxID=3155355 RepID=UPI0033CC24B1
MSVVENIRGPRDLKALSTGELHELAQDIGEFLIRTVAGSGGHPGPLVAGVDVPLPTYGVPGHLPAHAERSAVPAGSGLTPVETAGRISAALAAKESTE